MTQEDEVQALALRLWQASEHREPLVLTPAWWQERLFSWATGDPEFRVTLLRFVDTLPALRTATAIADHVRQYFRGSGPGFVRLGSGLADAPPFRPVLSNVVREGVYALAHRFIAGETPDAAVPRLQELAEGGAGYTVDLLGEATLSEAEADAYANRYDELLRTLSLQAAGPKGDLWRGVPGINVSIKLSALCSQFEPAAPERVSRVVRRRLLPLLRLAQERGAFINVDMEQYRYKDLVHHVFADTLMEPAVRDFDGLGIVVQAYLRDAEADIARLQALAERRGTPLTVRLVKGAYWEEETVVASQNDWPLPVYRQKPATDASYERCTERLLQASPHLRAAFGTHNPRTIAQAAVKARGAGLEQDIEFQMLFGMAEELRQAVAEDSYRTRVYTPVGAVVPGMAYLVRRLLENTSNQSWFLQGSGESAETIVAAPYAVEESLEPSRPGVFHNAPPLALHEPEVRSDMVADLESMHATFPLQQPLLIDGREIRDREYDEVRYPASPDVLIGRVARGTRADVDAAVGSALRAFPAWRDLEPGERADVLRRAADLMESRRLELTALMVYESAKPVREADGDVIEACDYLRYYADQAERLGAPVQMGDVLGEDNVYVRQGRGVTAVIAPWNFPLAIITGMTSAALAAGNCAIVKPAGQSPLIAARLVEVLQEAGVPGDVVHYLPGPGSAVGSALVEHADVATIAFTGSKDVGLGIIHSAAEVRPGQRQVKRVIAEMGGKNAIIVDEDADLDQAIAGVLVSAFGYAGQKCSACSRLIVVGTAYDELVARLAPAVASLVVGPPHEPSTFVPPVISAQAQQRIEAYIAAGRATATLLVQGAKPAGEGYYVAPTVFTDAGRDDLLVRDEIFGPLLSVFHAATMNEALEIALDSEYALTGGLYSRNPRSIEMARRHFRVGNLYINRKTTGAVVGRHPFGGLALSGVGDKAGGPDYLLQFLEARSVSENTMRRGFAPDNVQLHEGRAH